MNRRLALLVPLLLTFPALAQARAPDPNGVWMRGDGNARVRIASCGSKLCATNLWIGDTSGGEAVGHRLELTLKPKDDATLVGTAYDPQRDLNYSMQMTVGKEQLLTRGCVLGGLLCKSVTWSRSE
ncbi:DUF2147 domain-containing protein [Ancylobacter sp. A5.8]|uniref:DUF2147 domain-containing protein n=1 Tax=Ancylobacter gelatini TaxID=2919920 RepID=UPI001F4D65BC|nr:DUF2147 domain-containing protein [Ancylobacter gelatini]MCJ8145216.1 DUF2147 domain-containing protein [Ancylobacter gelatini]